MKISIDVELTPEEARRFFGLPDVAPMQDYLIKRAQEQMEAATDPAYLGKLASQLVAGGMQSMDAMQKGFFELLSGSTSPDRKAPKSGKNSGKRGESKPES